MVIFSNTISAFVAPIEIREFRPSASVDISISISIGIGMSPLLLLPALLALTRGETPLTKKEVLDMMEGLEAKYEEKLLAVKAELEEKYKDVRGLPVQPDRLTELPNDDVMLCVYKYHWTAVDSAITYDRYLDTNYDNGDRADMNLDTGIFTCLTSGFYTITYSNIAKLFPAQETWVWLYMNGERVDGSLVEQDTNDDTIGNFMTFSGSRTLVTSMQAYTITRHLFQLSSDLAPRCERHP